MTENQSPNIEVWCGYSAPGLGRCQCGDPANHQPGGRYYREGRLPDEDFVVVDDPIAQIADVLQARERGEMTDREALDFITSAIADHLADLNRDTEPVTEPVSLCPACGQPIDYCQGHGEFGDAYGRLVLDRHEAGDHSTCVIDCVEGS